MTEALRRAVLEVLCVTPAGRQPSGIPGFSGSVDKVKGGASYPHYPQVLSVLRSSRRES